MSIKCPNCNSEHIHKNGLNKNKTRQRYKCNECKKEFLGELIYSEPIKQQKEKIEKPVENKEKIPQWKKMGFESYSDYKDYILQNDRYICAECGKPINMFLKDVDNYAWKIVHSKTHNKKQTTKTEYYCSYTCYKKVLDRKEQYETRKEKAALINQYGGELTLKECEFCEDLKIAIEEKRGVYPRICIKSRENFKQFLKNYYDIAQKLIKEEY